MRKTNGSPQNNSCKTRTRTHKSYMYEFIYAMHCGYRHGENALILVIHSLSFHRIVSKRVLLRQPLPPRLEEERGDSFAAPHRFTFHGRVLLALPLLLYINVAEKSAVATTNWLAKCITNRMLLSSSEREHIAAKRLCLCRCTQRANGRTSRGEMADQQAT